MKSVGEAAPIRVFNPTRKAFAPQNIMRNGKSLSSYE